MKLPQTVLITGASSGIGKELAKLFAADRHDLVLIARNREALESLASELRSSHSIAVRVLPADLAKNSAPDEIYEHLQQESITPEIVVNNAGFGYHGPFVDREISTILEMLQVNMVALTHLTRLFLKDMLSRRSGRILNVASTAAFQPGPLMAVYYATKAYVLSLTEALANECKNTGVTITTLCPGPTRTAFQKRADMEDSGLVSGKVLAVMDAAAVAKAGYRGLMKGKTLVVPGLLNKIGVFSVRLGPRKLTTQIARSLQEKRKSPA